MSDAEAGSSDHPPISPWDRRVVRSLEIAESARRGVLALRVIAAVVVAATVVGNFLYIFAGDDGGTVGFSNLTQRFRIGQFFASVATPLAFAGLVFGLSYLVEINSARLDLDIVLDDAEETEGAEPEVAD